MTIILRCNGLPLAISVMNEDGWGGRSNFYGELDLLSLADCVKYIKLWNESQWYIFDGTTNICYVSSDIAKERFEKTKHRYADAPVTYKIGLP